MSTKISVIVPIYKVESFLHQCIKSVLSQTYSDIELILVDDGSPDRCGEICDYYSKNDSRVIVIHQKNSGLSAARNAGIGCATGEYVVFLDGDDYWSQANGLEQVINANLKTDVILFGMSLYYEGKNKYFLDWPSKETTNYINDLPKEKLLEHLLTHGYYTSSACNKLIKRSLLEHKFFRFKEHVTSEDIEWSAQLLLNAKSFSISSVPLYVYRQRKGSISKEIKLKNIVDLRNNIESCILLSNGLPSNNDFLPLYWNYMSYQYGTFLLSCAFVDKQNRHQVDAILNDMKQYVWLLKFHLNKKVYLLWKVNSYFGYKILCKICWLYAKFRHS